VGAGDDEERRVESGGWTGWALYSAGPPAQTSGVARAVRPLTPF
jgi:hypothetical protein